MEVLEIYSWNDGLNVIKHKHLKELKEVVSAIQSVNPSKMRTKISKEKTMEGVKLFSPIALIANPLNN